MWLGKAPFSRCASVTMLFDSSEIQGQKVLNLNQTVECDHSLKVENYSSHKVDLGRVDPRYVYSYVSHIVFNAAWMKISMHRIAVVGWMA